MENEANRANYEELGEHIKRLGGKLNGMTPGTEAYEETKEDLEMYYERLHQIEQMRTSTIEAERDEVKAAATQFEKHSLKLRRYLMIVSVCLVASVANTVEDHNPGALTSPLGSLISAIVSSTVATVIITGVLVHLGTRWCC